MNRTLTLRRESLAELSAEELLDVQGAVPIPTLLNVCRLIEVTGPILCWTGTTGR